MKIKPWLAAALGAVTLGCATVPSAPVAIVDEPHDQLVALNEDRAQTEGEASNSERKSSRPAETSSKVLPLENAGFSRPRTIAHAEPIATSLAGTIYEPVQATSLPPFVLADAVAPSAHLAVSSPSEILAPPVTGEPIPPGGPVFWISPEEQNGGAPCVVLNDQSLGEELPKSNWQRYGQPVWQNLVADECNFYSCPSLAWLAAGLGGGAILANTNLDEEFRNFVHGPGGAGSTDLDWMKGFGTGQYVLPSLAGIWVVDYWIDSSGPPGAHPYAGWLQEWSGRSLRGLIVGAVPLLSLQYITGGSRPGETSAGSHWKPFQDNNGVSGHSFVGAIPFWTAAQMTDCVPLQLGFYGMGTLAGISRIHTDSHYLSQVLLGWWLAGLSVAAVDTTEWQKRQWLLTPTVFENGGTGLAIMHQW